jgi:hypothetical protein
MIIEVKEYPYRGFVLKHVEKKGWKIVLDGVEILFPHAQAAEMAIDEFYFDVIKQHKGEKLKIPNGNAHIELKKHMTNGDCFRAMNDEALSRMLCDTGCPSRRYAEECASSGGCYTCWLEWLRQPVDVGDN